MWFVDVVVIYSVCYYERKKVGPKLPVRTAQETIADLELDVYKITQSRVEEKAVITKTSMKKITSAGLQK